MIGGTKWVQGVVAFMACASCAAFASDTAMERPSAFSIELGGRGGLYSLNYDYQVAPAVAFGAGVEALSLSGSSVFAFPVYANIYFAPGPSRVFATAGLTVSTASSASAPTTYMNNGGLGSVNAGVGYEYRGDNGMLFRATGYGMMVGSSFTPWGGLSLGAALP